MLRKRKTLKLKTSLLFLLNQYCKLITISCLASLSGRAFSQEIKTPPGIIESFERLLILEKSEFQKSKEAFSSNSNKISNFNQISNVRIDESYLRSLLFNSNESILRYAKQDECKFLASLENRLLRTSDKSDNILISYLNKEKKTEKNVVNITTFIDESYKKKCISNREISILFNETNIEKTINSIKFQIPQSETQCKAIHNEWLDNINVPYICQTNDILKTGTQKQIEFYRQRIPLEKRTYMSNLCDSLNNNEKFCSKYLQEDVWSKVVNSAQPRYKMSYKCEDMLGKSPLTDQDLKNCASKLVSDPVFCETKGNKDFPALFPHPNCNTISKALNHSNLITNYQDCPGVVDNEGLTNLHRILNHFSPRTINATRETCASESLYSLAKLNIDINNEAAWPLKICFLNRVSNQKDCIPYIPGNRPEIANTEDKVIAKILYQNKGATSKTKCSLVDKSFYNPQRSEYKFGCFIVVDTKNCTTLKCDKKVVWEEKNVSDIEFVGNAQFDYFPTTHQNERFSFIGMISEVNKVQTRIIRNLTDLKNFFNMYKTGIIHGVGCIEDLRPENYARESINQCTPTPFIVDGYFVDNSNTSIVFRLAIEDVHSPGLIDWQNLFNAVTSYQENHPLNTWTLNGLKK